MDWKHTGAALVLLAIGIILGFAAYSTVLPYLPGVPHAPTA